MTGLASRLRRTIGAPEPSLGGGDRFWPTAPPLEGQLERYHAAHERMQRWMNPCDSPPPLASVLPGEAVVSASGGECYVATHRFSRRHTHGAVALDALFGVPTDHLAMLTADERLVGFDPRKALFLDIESTGLDHGAGTLAFMVGIGHVDGDDGFVVQQLIVREPSEERAMLETLKAALDRFPFLVSFNGKSFDLTVLENRLVMHRLYTPEETRLKLRPHLDLLHLSRNLYRGVWADTKLQTLERRALDFVREDDLPGYLAPACWFAYVRHKDPEPLAAVALHNLHDVLSMVTLAVRVVADGRAAVDDTRPAQVAANLARLLTRRGQFISALEILDAIPSALQTPAQRRETLELAAAAARRAKDSPNRRRYLTELVTRWPDARDAWIALSIVEARLGAHVDALASAQRARALRNDEAVQRRISRLERRLAKAAGLLARDLDVVDDDPAE